MKRRLKLLILSISVITAFWGNNASKVGAAWNCPGSGGVVLRPLLGTYPTYCDGSPDFAANFGTGVRVRSTACADPPNAVHVIGGGSTCSSDGSGFCARYTGTEYSVASVPIGIYYCSQCGSKNTDGRWFDRAGGFHICAWDNPPTITISVNNPSTWVNSASKLNISGTITDPDSQNYTVSYSLSTTTTPGAWTVCRSASSTKKYDDNCLLA